MTEIEDERDRYRGYLERIDRVLTTADDSIPHGEAPKVHARGLARTALRTHHGHAEQLPMAEEEERKSYFIGAWDACDTLIRSPVFNKPQRAVIEKHAAIVRGELEKLGVTFTERERARA